MSETKLAMRESVDGRILKWSGVALALFLFGALASVSRVRGDAAAHTGTTPAATTAMSGDAPAAARAGSRS
jgi:uncharacterized membrane protein